MIISAPGYKSGTSSSLVELVDLYPTLSQLIGLQYPDEVQGKSLVPILKEPSARVRDVALTLSRGGLAIRSDNWAYMRYEDKTEELYNMDSDPNQFTNLVSNDQFKGALLQHRVALDVRIAKEGLEIAKPKRNKN